MLELAAECPGSSRGRRHASGIDVSLYATMDGTRMNLKHATFELQRRLYQWARSAMGREVAEDFPAVRACQYNRWVKSFLAWMADLSSEKRLPTCLALVQRQYECRLPPTERSSEAEAVFEEYAAVREYYHEMSGPVPDCDPNAPGFVRANPQRCLDLMAQELGPLCGKPARVQRYHRKFSKAFGEWTLSTFVEIAVRDQSVSCHSFLERCDCRERYVWSSRIDSLMALGIGVTYLTFIGQSHELLCTKTARASVEMFIPAIPKLIQGLGVKD